MQDTTPTAGNSSGPAHAGVPLGTGHLVRRRIPALEQDGARTFTSCLATRRRTGRLRLLWASSDQASRFSDFAFSPAAACATCATRGGRARDYEATTRPAAGPSTPCWHSPAPRPSPAGSLQCGRWRALEEIHEVLANAWLVMVVIHVAGVIIGSLAHRRKPGGHHDHGPACRRAAWRALARAGCSDRRCSPRCSASGRGLRRPVAVRCSRAPRAAQRARTGRGRRPRTRRRRTRGRRLSHARAADRGRPAARRCAAGRPARQRLRRRVVA